MSILDYKKTLWDSSLIAELTNIIEAVCSRSLQQKVTNVKAKQDYVTNLDYALEDEIRKCILNHFPDHAVYGEESIPDRVDFSVPTWLIDPLDGTSNYVFDLPFYGSAIAFVDSNKVIMGIVYDVIHKQVYKAFSGEGAYLDNNRIIGKDQASDFIGLSSGFIERACQQDPTVLIELKKIGKFRLMGSQALHLCYVASGKFKACVNYEAKAWDDLAGSLILKEAGGIYIAKSGFDPESLGQINTKENLFSIGTLSEEVRTIVDRIKL